MCASSCLVVKVQHANHLLFTKPWSVSNDNCILAYHGNQGLQSHAIAGGGLLHCQVHISVHLHQRSATLHSDPYLGVAVASHSHAAAVQVGWGCHLPPYCYGPMELS